MCSGSLHKSCQLSLWGQLSQLSIVAHEPVVLLLELSPLLAFEFDFLSLLCNMNTLWNILMMLGTNVEQDEMMCCVQE